MLVASVFARSSFAQVRPPQAPDPSAVTFFSSLIDAISNVAGTLDLYLSAGNWKSRVNGQIVLWTVDDNTRVTIRFKYDGSVLQDGANISFRPPIHVSVLTGNADFSVGVRSVTLDDRGRLSSWDTFADFSNNNNANAFGTMKATFTVSRTPKDLLTGRLFSGLGNPTPCDIHGRNCQQVRPMIKLVEFERTDASHPGLRVDLRPQKVIYLSKARENRTFDNFITIRDGQVEFDELSYDLQNNRLKGSLTTLDITAERGVITGRDLNLNLEAGSRLVFQFVNFRRESSGEVELSADSGTLSGAIGAGSRINLTTGVANASNIVFDSNSEAKIQGFRFHIDDARSTDIRIGGGSTVKVNTRSGRLGFGSTGFIAIGSGRIETSLSGDWDSLERPDATLQMGLVDIAITGGEFDLNQNAHVVLTAGNIKSNDLRFHGLEFSGVAGAFTSLDFTLDENSTFGIPSGFHLTTEKGGRLIAATPTRPLTLALGSRFPTGSVHLDLPFKRLENGNATNFSLSAGSASLDVTNEQDGTINGNGGIHGLLQFQGPMGILATSVELLDVKFQKTPTSAASLSSAIRMTLQPGLAFAISTPFVKGYTDDDHNRHDNFRAFPIRVDASLAVAAPSTAGTLTFLGNKVTVGGLDFAPVFRVSIPSGLGEHQEKNDENSANGEHGDDDVKHAQELVYDTFPLCDAHLYLLPGTYDFSSKLSISIADASIDIALNSFQSNTQISFKKKGCDLNFIGTLIGFLTGGFFAGSFGGIVGGVVGYKVGHSFEEKINDRVAGAIAERLLAHKNDWHVHI